MAMTGEDRRIIRYALRVLITQLVEERRASTWPGIREDRLAVAQRALGGLAREAGAPRTIVEPEE